jgi:pimeloyl-ACP methyl ester carboxylesterase
MIRANTHDVPAGGMTFPVLEWLPPLETSAHAASVVLLHGYMDGASTFAAVAELVTTAGYRVLAPDLRGFGDAPRTPHGSYYHFPDYVFDVADMVDQLVGGGPLFLVGHSMGGTIATLYAGTFPEKVTKLALLEGLGPVDNPPAVAPVRMRRWIDEVRKVRERPRPTMSLEDARRRLAQNHPHVDAAVIDLRVREMVREVEAGRFDWCFDPLHKTTSPTPFFARAFTEFLKNITSPVLVVNGGTLGYQPPDEDDRIRAIPGPVTKAELPDAGHMMHWTRPRELADQLLAFFG